MNYFLVWILVHWRTDGRTHTESDAYEPTMHRHRCAQWKCIRKVAHSQLMHQRRGKRPDINCKWPSLCHKHNIGFLLGSRGHSTSRLDQLSKKITKMENEELHFKFGLDSGILLNIEWIWVPLLWMTYTWISNDCPDPALSCNNSMKSVTLFSTRGNIYNIKIKQFIVSSFTLIFI